MSVSKDVRSGNKSSEALSSTGTRPNIIFVVLDDLGYSDIGCYGSEISTPNIDRLATNGVRYTNFHTTAMCSPTRASLLTGRQHHAVGMGMITEWATSDPGYAGRIDPRAANIAEVLQADAYATMAIGKWHVMPQAEAKPSGPFSDWPLQKGFDRWYGFHGALADSWTPELFEDNHTIDLPDRPGYHLTEDLIDQSISYIRDFRANESERPFFMYLALGAAHWPHQVAEEYIAKYKGNYDKGWDVIRDERLARQKALGVIPQNTDLAPRNLGVEAWDDLDKDRKRLFARMQEVYAGFIDHTDEQIGRLLDYLEKIEDLDNTIIVLLSDNGASPEGGSDGAVNARKNLVYGTETLEDKMAAIDELGSESAYNHYPKGWAQVSNTPLKWYKKDVHGGGVRDPFIVHWPAQIADQGTVRTQYHHVVDVVPTIMDLIGAKFPTQWRGQEQMPIHGVSMAYTLDDATAPTRKQIQYYEMLGDRGIWLDGWKAVALHEKGAPFEDDEWELYHVAEDFSECHNLADERPEKLKELVDLWWAEAHENQVLPLDDREYERAAAAIAKLAKDSYRFYPGMARLDRYHVPDITNRSYSITAVADLADQEATEGVLLSIGSRFGGLVLFCQEDKLVFEYSYDAGERTKVTSASTLELGSNTVLELRFDSDGNGGGTANLIINGVLDAQVNIARTWPVAGLAGGLHCGRDGASLVSESYTGPFAFNGKLHHVSLVLDGSSRNDVSTEIKRALIEE
ncbi:arylsulfatase [Arthrobacter sp. MYb227]|uniref:arylsulfatase n=1 Tax=Arthrobacter sp. MYb227 TaxID=1848601 RepID=UPI0015E328B0|nr:arylsulfatase [Arthrobacter sp. MYb227]